MIPAPDLQAETLPALPPRDRAVIAGLMLLVTALAWAYTAHHAHMMTMDLAMPAAPPAWGTADALLMFAMWTVMMAAMMVPSASPMIAAFATINHRRRERGAEHVASCVFLAGYLAVWAGFSLAATALQWALQTSGVLDATLGSSSATLSALLFLLAGAYQFSPLKQMCLAWCRSPTGFILSEWRDGTAGALVMGLRHGLFCTGCCAVLMLLLFAVAVMDLRWVAVLSLVVAAEKLLPQPRLWRCAIGIAAIVIGIGFAAVAIGARTGW